jgi:hypothetical protein
MIFYWEHVAVAVNKNATEKSNGSKDKGKIQQTDKSYRRAFSKVISIANL